MHRIYTWPHKLGSGAGKPRSVLREPKKAYGGQFAGENDALKPGNKILWGENTVIAET
jgi:hypothetical protein